MNIFYEVDRLVNFGLKKGLIESSDEIFVKNYIFEILNLEGEDVVNEVNEDLETATVILDNIAEFAVGKGLINDTSTEIDLFTTKIMGVLTPRPSFVNSKFFELYKLDRKKATEYFYNLSKDSNYIMVDRVKKNLEWDKKSAFGDYKITINVSKPEKTPEEIKAAKAVKSGGYPKCLLCKENVGFRGHLNHPARENLRIIPLSLNGEKWNMQYSPYVYYNEHCIIFKDEHDPMKITSDTFKRLLDFVEFLPHYFIGSNADLPIVGGSILSHDHFQGGNYELPMSKAVSKIKFNSKDSDVSLSIVDWAMSVIRISGSDKNELSKLANEIFEKWKTYNAESVDIISHTGDTPHNTVTPIARVNKDGKFEVDIVLRNNRTSEQYPDGIFHTHKETHHIKQENIGLIEVMGLAVLPKRLIAEFDEIKKYLSGEVTTEFSKDSVHYDWVKYLIEKYGTNNNEESLEVIFKEEIGEKFSKCLVDCGVFKTDEVGTKEFIKFINCFGFNEVQ